jgi:predicted transcriptional regulator YdeE
MIGILNRLVDEIEQHLGDELDIDELAGTMGTTGYHARRMFSSLAGMPVSDYVRRRRMTVAAADLIGDKEGVNPHIQRHVASLPVSEHERLKHLSNTDPSGLLQVSADVDPDYAEGSELTYLHGVAVSAEAQVPEDLDTIDVDAGMWVIFHASGPHPAALQEAYAASATEWFPSNPWRLRPGPSAVSVVDHAPDLSTATCEIWFPIERA